MSDPVNPSHYKNGRIEAIDAIESMIENQQLPVVEGFLLASMAQYLWRYNLKGSAVTDLEKAKWYLDRLILRVKERAAS